MSVQAALTIPKSVVTPLTRFGVSADADLVYRTLSNFGPQSIGELTASLGLAPLRVRTAIDELVSLAATEPGVRSRTDRARNWTAAPADLVVPAMRARHVEAARARFYLRQQLISVAEISHLVGASDLTRLNAVRTLHGSARVRARLRELATRSRGEVWSVQPEPEFNAETVRAAAPMDRALVDRGIQLRTLGVPAGANDETGSYERDMLQRGLEYRELPTLPLKVLLYDRGTAIIPVDPNAPGKGALEISAPSAVDGFVGLFMCQWGRARPPERGSRPTMRLNARERAIVSMLAAGHTDATTSEQLGLSARTIAYTLRSLMDRYGAQNRFQLGMMLGAYATDEVDPPAIPDEERQ